jgi:hypothetical protein
MEGRMKVISGNMIERLVQGISGGTTQAAQRSRDNLNSFPHLLEDVIQNGSTGHDTKINKDKLAVTLDLVKVQMTRTVMNAFTGDEDERIGGGLGFMFRISDMQGRQSKVSKNQQAEQPQGAVHATADMNAVIDKASAAYGVDRDLIRSIIQAESNFDVNATSPKGAMGLMQLMPDTARELGVSNAYDPEQNVMAGTRYLKSLLDRYNHDVRLALAAYNWGMGNLERSTGSLPEETHSYIARIMKSQGKASA